MRSSHKTKIAPLAPDVGQNAGKNYVETSCFLLARTSLEPQVLENLVHQSRAQFFSSPMHLQLRLPIAPAHCQMSASAPMSLELAALAGQQPLELLGIHARSEERR